MTEEALPFVYFKPRALENLLLTDSMDSLDPIVDAKASNLLGIASDTPQIMAACGRGSRSTFRTLRHGLDVQELVNSGLPGTPNAVWTVKVNEEDEYDTYIVLSFVNGTLVLTIGETIEEVHDTGFLSNGPTIAVQQLRDAGLLQVHPLGLRHVLPNKTVNEWACPPGTQIVAATTNKRQVVLALNTAELVYFELDTDGTLSEYQDRKTLPANASCLSIAEVPEGRQRTPFLVSPFKKLRLSAETYPFHSFRRLWVVRTKPCTLSPWRWRTPSLPSVFRLLLPPQLRFVLLRCSTRQLTRTDLHSS
jgi:splicing factor 3B subunit 3